MRVLIFSAGLALVGRFSGLDAAIGIVAIAAIYWCAATLRETYLLTLDDRHSTGALSASQPMDSPANAKTTASPTGATAAVPGLAAKATLTSAKTDELPSYPAEWAQPVSALAQLAKQRLSRRPALGKRTVRSMRAYK